MSSKVSLSVDVSPDALNRVNDAIESVSLQEDWPPDLLFTINLVIEELVLNIVNHAYGGDSGEFEIIITSEDQALTVELIDSGPPFNMLTDAPTPDVAASMEERQVGGLGIHLVKTMIDELDYKREYGHNHVTLVKRRDK